jgi:hypothetical protein
MNRKSLGYCSLLIFGILVSVSLAQDAVHDAEAVKRIQGIWSIAFNTALSKSTYEFKDTQAIVIQGVPCYAVNNTTPAGKKPGIYTIMNVKGQPYLFFGWPAEEGKSPEKLDKAFLLNFKGTNEFELHVAPNDPDKVVCRRK